MSDRDFAIIENHRVTNIARAGDAIMLPGDVVDLTDRTDRPAIGWSYDASTDAFAPPPAFSRDEAAVKSTAITMVNALAGDCRARYLTVVPGQAETYLLKADELRAYDSVVAANGAINPADYPILSSEASATNTALADIAQLVRDTRAAWIQLAAYVEGMRRGAIVAIENASSEAEVTAAIPRNWP